MEVMELWPHRRNRRTGRRPNTGAPDSNTIKSKRVGAVRPVPCRRPPIDTHTAAMGCSRVDSLAISCVSIDRFLQNLAPPVVCFSIVLGSASRHDAQHRRLGSSPLRMFPMTGSVAQVDNRSLARHGALSSATSDGKPNGETEFPTCLRSMPRRSGAQRDR